VKVIPVKTNQVLMPGALSIALLSRALATLPQERTGMGANTAFAQNIQADR